MMRAQDFPNKFQDLLVIQGNNFTYCIVFITKYLLHMFRTQKVIITLIFDSGDAEIIGLLQRCWLHASDEKDFKTAEAELAVKKDFLL